MARLSLPDLQYLATEGGYQLTAALSSFSVVLLLSACRAFLHNPKFWTGAGYELTPAELDDINELVAQAEGELMEAVGSGLKQPDYALYRMIDAGDDAGDFDSGAWRDVLLNTIGVTEGDLSLAAGSFTGIAGDFWFSAFTTGNRVAEFTNRLIEIAIPTVIGTQFPSSARGAGGTNSNHLALLSGFATLAADDDYMLQHRCSNTQSGTGQGRGNAWQDWASAGLLLYRV